ncbi:MAG: FISUMP domain-containing protein [Bacteroidota bacterium]|nr:FISUMP domain-containing protein [Bacteroidota bacterium]
MKTRLFVFNTVAGIFFAQNVKSQTFNCGDTLLDTRDGKKYATVLIGSACWMKQNLNYGTTITSNTSTVAHYDMTNNGIVEKYAPMGNTSNLITHGALYEWPELMNYSTVAGAQGICPSGWHVPTDPEFQTMIVAAGGTLITVNGGYGGNKLKNIGEGFGAGAGTNTSGFSAKHAGDRDSYGIFYGLTFRSIFWTSTSNGPSAYQYTLWADRDTIFRGGNAQKETGFSCRCVKDLTSSLKENSEMDLFQIYPNPIKDETRINIYKPFTNASYSIINAIGEIVAEDKLINQNTSVSLLNLKEGIYFISVLSDGQKTQKKIIIMR